MSEHAPLPPAFTPSRPDERRNARVAGWLFGAVGLMLAASFAAAPFYDLFCRMTGFGGTPIVVSKAPGRIDAREFTIRLDANVMQALGWAFEPEVNTVTVRAGEVKTVSYKLRNKGTDATTGIASYNVTPEQTGAFFNKIACFCFTEITLKAGEVRTEEVVFFVDPDISKDASLDAIHTITLSYTFFPAKAGGKPLADAGNLVSPRLGATTTSTK